MVRYGNKRKCVCCDKEVIIREYGRAKRMVSDEAVLCKVNSWICNECWKEIISEVKIVEYSKREYNKE